VQSHPFPAPRRLLAALGAALLAALVLVMAPSPARAGARFVAERIELGAGGKRQVACAARAARRGSVPRARRRGHAGHPSRRRHRLAHNAAQRRCAHDAPGKRAPAVQARTAPRRAAPAPPQGAAAPSSSAALRAQALDAGSVRLSWTAPDGAVTAEVLRDGRMVDAVAAAAGGYTDRELWERTAYSYTVRFVGAGGREVAAPDAGVTTPGRDAFARLYAPDAFVNRPVAAAPAIDGNSAAMVQKSIVPYTSSANFSNSDDWGIPIVSADVASRRYDVGCDYYWCDVQFGAFPIPADAAPSGGSDHHLAVLAPDGGELDMWVGYRRDDGWRAGTRWETRADGPAANCAPGEHCGGAVASNFALAAGVVRPEEIAQGHIDHALMITTPYTRKGVKACPATNTDGRQDDPAALPLGARVQLDPSLDVGRLALPAWKRTIARALQVYGAYVVDTGGSLAVRAESNRGRGYDAWSRAGVPGGSPGLGDLPWSRMRVLAYTAC
jgi:hypothetical protein